MKLPSGFQYFNTRLATACSLIAISSLNYGFDNQGFSTTEAMDAFDRRFGELDAATETYASDPSWLSMFNSLNYIGFAVGVFIGSVISSRFGRRWCMFCMSGYALITATITVTSQNRDQILAARILNYVYVGMELAVVPTFQSEIVPAPVRGLVVGTYQFSIILGGLIINSICKGTSGIQSDRAWRIPLGLYYIVPSIILCSRGRTDEAKRSLYLLRDGCFSREKIEAEFHELQAVLELEARSGLWADLVKGADLQRTALVVMVNFFQQATGQAFASQYGTVYIKQLGTVNPFTIGVVLAVINLVSMLVTLACTDKVGRRPMLLISSAVMAVGMLTMGGLVTVTPLTVPMKKGIVAMYVFLAVGFSLGWGPQAYIMATELPALRLRDKTLQLGFIVNVISNFVVNFTIPYLVDAEYANLESKVGFIFGFLCVCAFVTTYFFVPEYRGKTLEEIDVIFNSGVKLGKFGSTDASLLLARPQSSKNAKTETEVSVEKQSDFAAV
ncbi:putative sugar transporter [Aspergillus sclerotioniger CBS 115572]|uniref:Putative sugar transporter n=1 Tax=Aspergillus sclerotioniger CBS 115572 TaxID=1450535 RepID=A0A317V412_9EURO|nr:putative sugar transporter [Aspergillus sclerotioniger CBS 115572]PWY69014.1 putative sugar transporter [Aspergillus sclerotioniger CBS 115572]